MSNLSAQISALAGCLTAKRLGILLPRLHLVYRAHRFCCRFPAVRGQVRSYESQEIADKRSVARSAPTAFGQNQKQTGI
ncbi:hypothetical protein XJ28_15535 [Pseudomonas syringae pv. tomato]|nr:hypothetical protein XJ28_15535 [Pseudomonas syringae pv. tomato]QBI63235.1 hypothetical protein EIZ61_18075 [Pseudomonas syringae]TES68375.1 hypothetical protein E2N90_09065 [Pseudomonas syringae pv. tomato]